MQVERKEFSLLKYAGTSHLKSHIERAHSSLMSNIEHQREVKLAIKEMIPNKRLREIPKPKFNKSPIGLNLAALSSKPVVKEEKKKTILDKGFFKKDYSVAKRSDYTPLKFIQALWIMQNSRPCLLVEDVGLKRVVKYLDKHAPFYARNTISRACRAVYGFTFDAIRHRIRLSQKYFRQEPFIVIQGDSWTSQGNLKVFGVSCSI